MICRVCDSNRLNLVIDLDKQPWCNHFLRREEVGKEPFYPLKVVHCADCETAQLDFTVPKETMFGDHTYLSGVTRSLSQHFEQVAREVNQRFFNQHPEKTVLDIGSNDGTQLKHYQKLGWKVLGVESSKGTAKRALEQGVPTQNVFFNQTNAQGLGGPFQVINASGVFFHLEELHSVADGIRSCLAPDGVFLVQFLYMQKIVENGAFDQIYHEHLLYYNLKTLERLLQRHGLTCFDAYLVPIHGGSMMAFVQHRDGPHASTGREKSVLTEEERKGSNRKDWYLNFAQRIARIKRDNIKILGERKSRGKRIYGMGAPVKGNTLLNYFKIGPDTIDCLVEKNELRRNLFSPGMHIPIRMENEIETAPDVYYVLAWNFKHEILKKHADLLAQGVEFLFPVDPDFLA
ncbi:MAG: class I SAM-dependent methyltransferase [Verrucomicrobia bacterium]|nr:class I SAM-dependent methyltransferase [Verrucomicrobiota bacterium]